MIPHHLDVMHKISHLVSAVTSIPPLLECLFGEVQYFLRILQCLYQGNLSKGIENCLGAGHKAVKFLWMQDLVKVFLNFNFYSFSNFTNNDDHVLFPFRKYFLENIIRKNRNFKLFCFLIKSVLLGREHK